MVLRSFMIQNATAKEKPYKLADGDGLYLLVQSSDKMLWRFRYRFADKENMLALGSFPEVPLVAARAKKDEARKLVTDGTDPAQHRKLGKFAAAVAAGNAFAAIAEEHLQTLKAKGLQARREAAVVCPQKRWIAVRD